MSLTTTSRRRIEILVDAPLLKPVLELLRTAGATGYTVLPTLKGEGLSGGWTDDQISSAEAKVMVLAVAEAATAERLLELIEPQLSLLGIIVLVSTVEVLRPEHFG